MVKLISYKKNFGINLPTKLSEITPEYLNKMTEHITVAENYAMIALVLTTKLSEYCYTIGSNKGKEPQIGVTPVIVKYSTSDDIYVKFEAGDIAIVSNTDIERAHHCRVPSMISSDNVANYLMDDDDLRKGLQIGEIKDESGNRLGDSYIKILQFKILPISDIHGSFKPVDSITDDFVFSLPHE